MKIPVLRTGSIRTRLALMNVVVLALALAVMGVMVRYILEANLRGSIDHELRIRSRPLSEMAFMRGGRRMPFGEREPQLRENGGTFPYSEEVMPPHGEGVPPLREGGMPPREGNMPPPRGRPGFDAMLETSEGYIVLQPKILDLQGKMFISHVDDPPWDAQTFKLSTQGREVFSTITVKNQPVRVLSTPILRDGAVVGVVQLPYPMTDLVHALNRLTLTLLALIPVALLIAGVGGAFLTNRMIQPVRQMTRTAEQVSAEDLSGRLPIQGNDEFADLASTFNKMMGRLQEAFTHLKLLIEQQRRFTADASHELRTPLTVIKAKTSLALRGDRSPEEYRQALDSIDRAADTMNRLVQDLLLLARSDTGQLGLNLTPITVQDVLEPAAEIVQKPESATITLNMPDDPVKLCGDLHALIRLFTNLLENALQHTPSGGKVIVDVESGEEMVSISVKDTGEGISPEHLPHVFERFYRADASRTRASGGTGLGLAICKSIAEAHHGTISIDSTLGEGTLVKVMLPLDIPDFS